MASMLRVYRWALASRGWRGRQLTGAAALVHDLVNIPKDTETDRSARNSRQSIARTAGGLRFAAPSATPSSRPCARPRSRGLEPTSAMGAVLQDADRLDALGAVGIAQPLRQLGHVDQGKPRFYDPEDPLARSGRARR